MEIREILLDQVKLDPNQPRKIVDNGSVANLAKSLKVEGLIHPIEVDANYVVIVGEIRVRAARSLGWKTIRASINDRSLLPYERLRRQMAENLQQSGTKGGGHPMNPVDTAKALRLLYKLKTGKDSPAGELSREETYGKFKEIIEEVGISKTTVWEYLTILDQPKYVLEDIERGRPRTLYREADRVSERYREPIKKAISEGKIENRDDIRRFKDIERIKPTKAEIEFLRITQQQSEDANRILSLAVELGFALTNAEPEKFSPQDKKMVHLQLNSTTGAIRNFIGKLKT